MKVSIRNNYNIIQSPKLRQTVTYPNSAPEEAQAEVAFKGKFENKKLFASLSALSAAALGFLGVKKKEQEALENPETIILDKIKRVEQENPELVEKLKYPENPEATLKMLELHEKHPEEVEGLAEINKLRTEYSKFGYKDIESLVESYKSDPEACKELATWKRSYSFNLFDSSQIIRLTPEFKENKHAIKELQNLLSDYSSFGQLGKNVANILDSYKKSPKAVDWLRKVVTLDRMNEAVDLYNQPSGAKYFEQLHEELLTTDRLIKMSERFEFVAESIKNDKFLTDLETKIPDISKELDVTRISRLNKLSDDDKKNIDRIIADGRIPKYLIADKICELLPIYAKYPDKKVTDEMIRRYYDPIAQVLGL